MFQWMRQKASDIAFALDRWRYREGKYYKVSGLYTDKDGPPQGLYNIPFEIIRGKFKGTIYCYSIFKHNIDGGASYGHHVIRGDYARSHDDEFSQLTRKILLNILWKMVAGEVDYGVAPFGYEDRIIDPEKPNEERAFREKGSSVFED